MNAKTHIFGLFVGVISFALGSLSVGLVSSYFAYGRAPGPPPAPMQPGKNIVFRPMTSVRRKPDAEPLVSPSPIPAEPTKPFCRDKRILPVWNQIKRKVDKEQWKHAIEFTGIADCSKFLEAMYFDLDRDGRSEILVRASCTPFCGATGNCSFWIFKKVGQSYKEILETGDYVDIVDMGDQILRTKTNGFNDILVKSHLNASDTAYSTYRHNGRKYVLRSDLVSAHHYDKNGKVYWKFITLEEWSERRY